MSTPDTNYHEPTVREALAAERSSTTAVPVRDQHPRDAAAQATLKHLGYTYEGGEQWKPPLGKKPDFDLIDALHAEVERLTAERDALREFAQWLIDSYHSEDGMPPDKDVVREARSVLAARTGSKT